MIIQISPDDGKYWSDWVCVNPKFPNHVSPLWYVSLHSTYIPILKVVYILANCSIAGENGSITIDNNSVQDMRHFVGIHRGCLSLFCHFTNSTPKMLFDSLYAPGADYGRYGQDHNGLLYCLKYIDMEGRNGWVFGYGIQRQTERKNEPGVADKWHDPETMEKCNWLLARPTIFPKVKSLPSPSTTTFAFAFTPSPTPSLDHSTVALKVIYTPELLDLILPFLFPLLERSCLATEMQNPERTSSTLTHMTRMLFSLLEVNKYFCSHILESRQDLFLLLAWQHAWMLPCTPMDLQSWNSTNDPIGSPLRRQPNKDWRSYLLAFLCRSTPHIRNRHRMHRMAQLYAGGVAIPGENWRWSCGELGVVPLLAEENTAGQEWETTSSTL